MTKRPVLRLTGAQLASIDPPVSEEWFIDADEYEDFVVAATPGEVERGKNWYGSTMERAGAAARHATPTPDDRDRLRRAVAAMLVEDAHPSGSARKVMDDLRNVFASTTPTPDDRDREVERIAAVCYCRMCTLLRDLDHLRVELEPLQSVLNGILSDGPVMDTLDADGPWWTPPDPTGVRLHDALIAASKAVDAAIDAGLRASGGN